MSERGSRRTHSFRSPYVGWRPFARSDSRRFFGRASEIRDVQSLWRESRIVVLHGQGAAGKTSLLQAGLLPSLTAIPKVDVLPIISIAPYFSWSSDAAIIQNLSNFLVIQTSAGSENRPPRDTSLSDLLSFSKSTEEHTSPVSVLAAVDQLERLFVGLDRERDDFFDDLVRALHRLPSLRLLLIIDSAALERFKAYDRRLNAAASSSIVYFKLETLSGAAALDAVTRPLINTGRRFDTGVAEQLIDQIASITATQRVGKTANYSATTFIDPLLLQIFCTQLWSKLPPNEQVIRLRFLQNLADIDQASHDFYDDIISELNLTIGIPENLLRRWIESTFISETGRRRAARRGQALTARMPSPVADALVDYNFLTIELRPSGNWYKLKYELLIPAIRNANRLSSLPSSDQDESDYRANPETSAELMAAAKAAFADGIIARAHRLAGLAAARYRNSGDEREYAHALMLRGNIACAQRDLSSAERDFRTALLRFTVLQDRNLIARTLSALAEVQFLAGDYKSASKFQQLAVAQLPTDVDALIGLGYAQWYAGSPADAEASFTQALTWDIHAARAFAGRGQVRAEMQDYAPALTDIDRALEAGLSPDEEINALTARALALMGLGRSEEADQELATARRRDPSQARTHLRSARVAQLRGQSGVAVEELEQALGGEPSLTPREQAGAREMLVNLRITES